MPELSDHMARMLAPHENPDEHYMMTRRHRAISTALYLTTEGLRDSPEQWRDRAQELVDVTVSDEDQQRYARCETDEERQAVLLEFYAHVAGLYDAVADA